MADTYVAISELAVPPEGADDLEAAFRGRLGAVDSWPGFVRLSVLRDRRAEGRYLMVTEWTSKEAFTAYMRSAEHKASHDRIPGGDHAPRAAGFRDYDRVAE
jgi:heme oxygenase (mycobilin-producing)